MSMRMTGLASLVATISLATAAHSQAAYTLTETTPVPPLAVFDGTTFTFNKSSPGTGGVQTGSTLSDFNVADVAATSNTAPPSFDSGTALITQTFTLTGSSGVESFTLSGTLTLLSGSAGGIESTFDGTIMVNSGGGYDVSFAGYAQPTPGSSGIGATTGSVSILVNPTPSTVPEPASVAMLGLGLVGVGGLALRRRMAR